MAEKIFNVLFLCTGNSARSVMAEAYLNSVGRGRFQAFSAGSMPTGKVNPHSLDVLKIAGVHLREQPRSKSWSEFAESGAPEMDFVITVCDSAAGEVCPIWPGQPMNAHWGFPDPAAVQGTDAEKQAAFLDVFRQIRARIDIFVNLPMASLDRLALKKHLDDIGKVKG